MKKTSKSQEIKDLLGLQLKENNISFKPEYLFAKSIGRKWRTDHMIFEGDRPVLACETEGGLFVFGRHNRPISMIKDMEKYNTYTLFRIHLLRFTPQQIKNNEAIKIILEFLGKS